MERQSKLEKVTDTAMCFVGIAMLKTLYVLGKAIVKAEEFECKIRHIPYIIGDDGFLYRT